MIIGQQPFLDAICANPAEDAPRLVFADWLEERGECDRAELIRVQIELARTQPYTITFEGTGHKPPVVMTAPKRVDNQRYDALRRRSRELLADYAHIWFQLERLHEPAGDASFAQWWGDIRRGFRWHVRCTLAEWCGGPCERCDGEGGNDWDAMNTWNCTACGGNYDHRGTGTTTGHAGEICLRHPIESVTLTDRSPYRVERKPGVNGWTWLVEDAAHAAVDSTVAIITPELADHLDTRWYPTEADALAALDSAAVKLGRKRAEKLRIDRKNKYGSA